MTRYRASWIVPIAGPPIPNGWVIVDTGLQTSDTTAAWRKLFCGLLGAGGVTRVLVTHMHPDHVGMAGWLTRKFDCRLWMTRLEYLTCRTLVADTGREAPEDGIRFYRITSRSEDCTSDSMPSRRATQKRLSGCERSCINQGAR